jgi:predicted aspartyl protease
MHRQLFAAALVFASEVALAQRTGPMTESAPPLRPLDYTTATLAEGSHTFGFVRFVDGVMLENVMVNGSGPYRFMLDTGAEGGGRLDISVVEALQIPKTGESQTLTPEGPRAVTEHTIETLTIGPLTFTGVQVLSRDYHSEIPPGFKPFDGILGYHLFRDYLLTIDYPARTIKIDRGELPPADGETILNIISDDDDPEVEVTIGGRTCRALLDTGGMTFVAVPASFEADLVFSSPPQARGPMKMGPLSGDLRIGAVAFHDPQVLIGSQTDVPIVGARALAALRLTFDQRNRRVHIEKPPERRRFGVAIPWRDDRLGPGDRIIEVVAGGIAEAAGLRAGDQIISINGIAPSAMNREDVLRALDGESVRFVVERGGERIEAALSIK